MNYSYFRLIRTKLLVPRVNFLYFSLSIIGNRDISHQIVSPLIIRVIEIPLSLCNPQSKKCSMLKPNFPPASLLNSSPTNQSYDYKYLSISPTPILITSRKLLDIHGRNLQHFISIRLHLLSNVNLK